MDCSEMIRDRHVQRRVDIYRGVGAGGDGLDELAHRPGVGTPVARAGDLLAVARQARTRRRSAPAVPTRPPGAAVQVDAVRLARRAGRLVGAGGALQAVVVHQVRPVGEQVEADLDQRAPAGAAEQQDGILDGVLRSRCAARCRRSSPRQSGRPATATPGPGCGSGRCGRRDRPASGSARSGWPAASRWYAFISCRYSPSPKYRAPKRARPGPSRARSGWGGCSSSSRPAYRWRRSARAAPTNCCACSMLTAAGTSLSTWTPASQRSTACGTWWCCGEETITASTCLQQFAIAGADLLHLVLAREALGRLG